MKFHVFSETYKGTIRAKERTDRRTLVGRTCPPVHPTRPGLDDYLLAIFAPRNTAPRNVSTAENVASIASIGKPQFQVALRAEISVATAGNTIDTIQRNASYILFGSTFFLVVLVAILNLF